jgi:hypothetical protein
MKIVFGKSITPARRATTYVRDAHPLVAQGEGTEWLLRLKSGELVNPLLFCGLDAAGEPTYAMGRTAAHPNGDYAFPSITSVSVSKDGRRGRTVHAPEFTQEIAIHVAAVRAAFSDPDFVTAVLAAIGEQEKVRRKV